ncbi:MAG: hypothetical protein ACI81R_002832 [Bradymonadia bacterium]|jgi:hypothetical protein
MERVVARGEQCEASRVEHAARLRVYLGVAIVFTALLASCAGVRSGQTANGIEPHMPSPISVANMSLLPITDTFVTNQDGFELSALEAEPWIASGADGDGGMWVAWLVFDIGVCAGAGTPSSVTLVLTTADNILVESDVASAEFALVAVRGQQREFTWLEQPETFGEPISTVRALPGSEFTEVDLTDWFAGELSIGSQFVTIGIAPRETETSLRMIWSSTEGTNSPPRLDLQF